MCTILTYKKCSCFLFLVILAVFSSGFRIDNTEMTLISTKNSHTSLVNSDGLASPHRIRHERTTRTSKTRVRKCPEIDVTFKACKSDAVALAKVESISTGCVDKAICTVQFKVTEWLKNATEDRLLRLNFRYDSKNNYCDYDALNHNNSAEFLVSARFNQSKQSKEYILFLRTPKDVPHVYYPYFVPLPANKKPVKRVRKVLRHNFQPKPTKIEKIEKIDDRGTKKKLKLHCRVQGIPIPIIRWKRNNTFIHPERRIRINHNKKSRKRSTLVIMKFSSADWGEYECVAEDVSGNKMSQSLTIRGLPGKPCPNAGNFYCQNGGMCFYEDSMDEMSCQCPDGFKGKNCEIKSPDSPSTYRQTPTYTCKMGIYTKYDNC